MGVGVVCRRWALPTPAPSPWFLPPHCRCRPGRGCSWGSVPPPSPPSSLTASAGATATCGSPSPRGATSDVSRPPGPLWAPVPLLQRPLQSPLVQESSSPFLFLENSTQPSSLLVRWGSGARWGSRVSFVILEAGFSLESGWRTELLLDSRSRLTRDLPRARDSSSLPPNSLRSAQCRTWHGARRAL